MATYPLPTLGCTLDATGISAPSYADVLASLTASAQSIFGADVYLEPDSQDGQLLAIFAKAIYDQNSACIATYNSFSPVYAQGAGLASLVKINGITVAAATNSTVLVTLAGTVGTVITNGVVQDTGGNLWNLPPSVTIPVSGAAMVTATAQATGAITAASGTVTTIYTPTYGWSSVTNSVAAAPGAPVLTDAQVRQLQMSAVALPSQAIGAGILAALENIPGVSMARVYENYTDVADANGLPPHSISPVVQGGDSQAIVNAIGLRKTPGTNTFGSASGVYVDSTTGFTTTINYSPLATVPLKLLVTVQALPGFSASTNALIQSSVAAYVSGLGVGASVYRSKLYGPLNLYGDAATVATGLTQAQLDVLSSTYVVTDVQIGPVGGAYSPADYVITPFQAAVLSSANVTVVVI